MSGIVINGRYLTQGMTGVQRFATEIVAAADALAPLVAPAASTVAATTFIVNSLPCSSSRFALIQIEDLTSDEDAGFPAFATRLWNRT